MDSLLLIWYDWGVFLGVFVAAAVTIYIFFDAQDSFDPTAANGAKALAAIGLVLTIPSLYVRLTIVGDFLAEDIVALQTKLSNAPLFGYLGMLGMLLALGVVLYYYFQLRSTSSAPAPTEYITPPPVPEPVRSSSKPRPVKSPIGPTQPIDPEPQAAAWLVVRSGARSGNQYQLSLKRSKVLGRDPGKADITLDDDTVSREHARVQFENGEFVLYDLGSNSGTFVNGHRVQRQMLYDDDRIGLGRVELIYKKA